MMLAHAVTLAAARSHLAALADQASTFDASADYELVLLQLDWIHGDDSPALHEVLTDDSDVLYRAAATAIEALLGHGADALQVELALDMLHSARAKDEP